MNHPCYAFLAGTARSEDKNSGFFGLAPQRFREERVDDAPENRQGERVVWGNIYFDMLTHLYMVEKA